MARNTGPIAIIAVRDVAGTSKLLVAVLGWKSVHGGDEFDILTDAAGTPTLMLHDFDSHEHARFAGIKRKSKGVGHSLYVFVPDLDGAYRKVKRRKLDVVEAVWRNPNTRAREFTFRLEEGYQFSVCETDGWLYWRG